MSEPSRSTLEVRSLRVLAQVPDFLFPEMKPPAFQFYADDFLGGTLTMTLEERGLYITLLCLQWSKGFVTEDDFERLGSAMAQPSRSHVRGKFQDDDRGCLRNERLEEVRRKQDEFRASRSTAGKEGAAKRWHSHSTANGSAMAQPMAKDSSPSPSPNSVYDIGKSKRSAVASPTSDSEWLEELGKNPAYAGLSVPTEFAKMRAWCSANSKQPTRRRFVNWLNRAERPMATNAAYKPAPVPIEGPKGWRERLEAAYPGNRINAEGLAYTQVAPEIREKIA